jgi:two-component system, OmpR family, sensor kinase
VAKDDDPGALAMHLLAHELRNPLTAVQLNAQLIERAAVVAGREKEERRAALIVGAARRLDGMIQQLVEAERLRLGQMELSREPLVWGQFWRDLCANPIGGLEPGRVRLVLPEQPVVVSGDCERLGRAIRVLVSLAMEQAGGTAQLAVEVQEEHGEVTSLIRASCSPAAASSAGSAATAVPAGSGIALHFARSVFESHGGHLRSSEAGPDAVLFAFVLPTTTLTSART